MNKRTITIGTAGHIDHGKTSLVKRLTGIDTDRLKEEKERGMTIELGFAHMELEDCLISIVDVPGHEKFIKNMVAGAHGIDGVLFVIAADEGIMPQTREHLIVCEMLGISRGIVILTKVDTVDDEWLELVEEDLKGYLEGSFLENAPIVKVSSKTGKGFDELKKELVELLKSVSDRDENSFPRLPIDRVFSVKGFGTVVTGTLTGGSLRVGDRLRVYPSLKVAKVKSVQVAGKTVRTACPGQRTALNLDISKDYVERGNMLAPEALLKGTTLIDVVVRFSETAQSFEKRKRIHFHYLTQMVEGEVVLIDKEIAGAGDLVKAQVILDKEIFPVFGDRFVLRSISPSSVIGGGIVLHPLEERRFRKKFKKEFSEKMEFIKQGKVEALKVFVEEFEPLPIDALPQLLNFSLSGVSDFVSRIEKESDIIKVGLYLYTAGKVKNVFDEALKAVSLYHERFPVKKGMNRETLKSLLSVDDALFENVILDCPQFEIDSEFVRKKGFVPFLDKRFENFKEKIDEILLKSGFAPPAVEKLREKIGISKEEFYALLEFLKDNGYRMAGEFLLYPDIFLKIKGKVLNFLKDGGVMSVTEFKELFSLSRKYAIPFLELLDREGITERKESGIRKIKSRHS